MRLRTPNFTMALAVLLVSAVILVPASVRAQGVALDDDDDIAAPAAQARSVDGPPAQVGFGLRLRQVHVLAPILELFFGHVPHNAAHFGIGAEFIRQKGNFALTLGVEYEQLGMDDGLWLEKGDNVPQDEPDLIEFEDFGWVGVDVNFIWHANLGEMFAIRYGAGLGVGLILGEAQRTDYRCTTTVVDLNDATCQPSPMPAGPERRKVDDIPPVFPILNMIVGGQFRPTGNIAINVEGGIRSFFPFVGTTVSYLF